MRYLAIEIRGQVFILNDSDELGGLIDYDIPHKILGEVCEDSCSTCPFQTLDTCPAFELKDWAGDIWKITKRDGS